MPTALRAKFKIAAEEHGSELPVAPHDRPKVG
jgi:hypothetical protein